MFSFNNFSIILLKFFEIIIYLLDKARSLKEEKHIHKNVFDVNAHNNLTQGHTQPGQCCQATQNAQKTLRVITEHHSLQFTDVHFLQLGH